jgi:hypothetical protein
MSDTESVYHLCSITRIVFLIIKPRICALHEVYVILQFVLMYVSAHIEGGM